MTICFITVCDLKPTAGGVERVCVNIITELLVQHHNVISCYLDKNDVGIIEGVDSYRFPNDKVVNSAENIEMLSNVVKQHSVDIIWNHSHYIDLHKICVEAKGDAKLVYTYHSDPCSALKEKRDDLALLATRNSIAGKLQLLRAMIQYPIGYYLRRKYISRKFRYLYDQSDTLAILSDRFINSFNRLTGFDDLSKLVAINNPIYSLSIPEVDIAAKNKQIVFVGRLIWGQKRLDRLLKVWALLQNRLPDWNVVVLGDGPHRELYVNMACKLNLRNIEFKGTQPSEPYYAESSVLCMTSTYEGFGMVLVEAQQYGCVPMAFDSFEAVHDIIEDGVNGVIVSPFNTKEYANKLYDLCQDKTRREQMAIAGIESVKRFDSKIIVGEWLELFEELIK
ncbi:MAG: glycosyltransferase [Rikenellaceae bacterium]